MDQQPTTPMTPSPATPALAPSQTQQVWVPQNSPVGQTAPAAPPPKPGMPMILKVMIGCGSLFLIIPILMVIVLFALNPAERLEKAKEALEKTATSSATPSNNTTNDWSTIKGEITLGTSGEKSKFEFKAPREIQVKHPYGLSTNNEGSEYYFGAEGSGIKFFAGMMEGPGPLTVLFGRADENNLCAKPLSVQEPNTNALEVCDIISVDGRKMLWLLDLHTIGGDGGACLQDAKLYVVYNVGEYSSIYFTPELEILNEALKSWPKVEPGDFCPDNLDNNEVKRIMTENISNIRNATNLSESDVQRLKMLYKILSTFKFL